MSGFVVSKLALVSELRGLDSRVPSSAQEPCVRHSLTRWSFAVVGLARATQDPRTVTDWGRAIGLSAGALRTWCRTARLPPRRSLLFARLLRAILFQATVDSNIPPEQLLDVVDQRTLTKWLLAAGGTRDALPSLSEFLERQTLIADGVAVSHVRVAVTALLAERQSVSRILGDGSSYTRAQQTVEGAPASTIAPKGDSIS